MPCSKIGHLRLATISPLRSPSLYPLLSVPSNPPGHVFHTQLLKPHQKLPLQSRSNASGPPFSTAISLQIDSALHAFIPFRQSTVSPTPSAVFPSSLGSPPSIIRHRRPPAYNDLQQDFFNTRMNVVRRVQIIVILVWQAWIKYCPASS